MKERVRPSILHSQWVDKIVHLHPDSLELLSKDRDAKLADGKESNDI